MKMDGARIEKLLRKRCGKTFLGVFAIDRLPMKLPQGDPFYWCVTRTHMIDQESIG